MPFVCDTTMQQHFHLKKQNTVVLFGKKQNLNPLISVKTDTLNCNLCPGSIQCEKTSFPASFARSAGNKNNFRGYFLKF